MSPIEKGDKSGEKVTVEASDFVSITVPDTSTDFHIEWRNADGSLNPGGVFAVDESGAYATKATDGGSLGARF